VSIVQARPLLARCFASKRFKKKAPEGSEDIPACVAEVREKASAKFDETVELVLTLKIDPRKANELVRGMVSLPHGTGKKVKVAVFAREDRRQEALDAGAHIVGEDELVQAIKDGNLDFDHCVATPDMMSLVGSVARILGPRGLMPNPKLGTVTNEIGKIVTELQAGRIEYRNDKTGNIHAGIGKVSFTDEQLLDNVKAFTTAVLGSKPAHIKGEFVRGVTICSTMGPGIRILPSAVDEMVGNIF